MAAAAVQRPGAPPPPQERYQGVQVRGVSGGLHCCCCTCLHLPAHRGDWGRGFKHFTGTDLEELARLSANSDGLNI